MSRRSSRPPRSVPDAGAAATQVFREQSGRILATLIRVCGSFDLAEDALQDAFAAALDAWRERGLPANPAAWITAAAQRKLIDRLRRERTRRDKQEAVAREFPVVSNASHDDPPEIDAMNFPDDRLRLLFTCCHPALAVEGRVALTLRTLGGLTTPEIARAFLLPEATLAQRLVRAKRKIREAGIPYAAPAATALPERLASVQAVIYLIFNEGYAASSGDGLIRGDLCGEAIRLARLLRELMAARAENSGLLALLLLQDSRRAARLDRAGALVPLAEQDRSLWDQPHIQEGLALLDAAIALHDPGPYQIQAAIAALHAQARAAADTDWPQIEALYARLVEMLPTPVVKLNHAVAVAMARGFDEGLHLIDELAAAGGLDGYYLLPAARADLLRRLGRHVEAAAAYREAVALTVNPVERAYLERRLAEVRSATRPIA